LVGSEAVELEILKTPDYERRVKVSRLSKVASFRVLIGEKVIRRARQLQMLKFSPFDALHIACAEDGKVDVMLTTDKKLLKKIKKEVIIKLKVCNPLDWLKEVLENEQKDRKNESE